MAKPWAKKFYRSKRWQSNRAAYAESVNWLCEICGDPGEIVHHARVWLTAKNIHDPEVSLAWSNLQLLCIECHNKVHGRGAALNREGFFFDDEGNLRHLPPIRR